MSLTDVAGFDLSWCDDSLNRNSINELVGLEAVSIDLAPSGDSHRFRPYPLSILGRALRAAIRRAPSVLRPLPAAPVRFLEVGCGIGAKMVMVEKVFGWDVSGFDNDPQYVEKTNGLLDKYACRANRATVTDAQKYRGYDAFDVIYLNRPLWSYDAEKALEERVAAFMSPGAILVLGNGATVPHYIASEPWPLLVTETALAIYFKPQVAGCGH